VPPSTIATPIRAHRDRKLIIPALLLAFGIGWKGTMSYTLRPLPPMAA
jgi:hypothetical protein